MLYGEERDNSFRKILFPFFRKCCLLSRCWRTIQLDGRDASRHAWGNRKLQCAWVGVPISLATRSCGGCDSEAIEPRRNAAPATSANRSDHARYGLEKDILRTGEKDSVENSKLRLENAAGPQDPFHEIGLASWNLIFRRTVFFTTHRQHSPYSFSSYLWAGIFNFKRKRSCSSRPVTFRSRQDRKDCSMIANTTKNVALFKITSKYYKYFSYKYFNFFYLPFINVSLDGSWICLMFSLLEYIWRYLVSVFNNKLSNLLFSTKILKESVCVGANLFYINFIYI